MPGRILIADSVATSRITMKVRMSAATYNVFLAETGQQVLDLAALDPPDLFILDIDLPDIGGINLCQRLRAQPALRAVPILLISAHSDTATRLRGLAAGADEFLTKPTDETTLLARVRNLLRARVVAEELKLRQGTALELGFSEAPTPFQTASRITLVASSPKVAVGWRSSLRGRLKDSIEVLPKDQVLAAIREAKSGPDVIVISSDMGQPGNGLTLLAELRSRSKTRHSAVIVVHPEADQAVAVSALDMGANDLLTVGCDPQEMALRIQNQMVRKRQADRLRNTVEDSLKLALIDPLTGLFNRRYALPHLSRIAASAATSGHPFAVMVLDLDHFKRINDRYGHSAGDAVLREVSQRVKNNLRSVDLVARIGGEEFLVVMPDTDLTQARAAAERLREVTADHPVRLADDQGEIPVTISIGFSIGGMTGDPASPVQKLVDLADHALMDAKSEGRNQVTFGQSAA